MSLKIIIFIFLFIFFNFIFYKSIPGEFNRYAFPYIYLVYLICCVNLIIIYNNYFYQKKYYALTYIALIFFLVTAYSSNKIILNLKTQKKLALVQQNNYFNLNEIIKISKNNNIDNFFVTGKLRYSTYEGAKSLKKYVNFYINKDKNIYLIVEDDKEFRKKFRYSKQIDYLYSAMSSWSFGKEGFSNISKIDVEQNFNNCIELTLTKNRDKICKYSFFFKMI